MSQVTGTSPKRDQLVQEMRSHFRSKYLNSPQLLTRIDQQISALSQLKRISPKDIERTERSLRSYSNQCSSVIPPPSADLLFDTVSKVPPSSTHRFQVKQSPTPLPFKIGLPEDEGGHSALPDEKQRRSSFASFPRNHSGEREIVRQNGGGRPGHKRSLLSPNKTSVWAAMIMHDQLKHREEELLKQERVRREKAELRNFYHSQIQQKQQEENKWQSQKRKHESDTIEKGRLEEAQEEAKLRFKRHQWQQTVRNQYLKSLDRSGPAALKQSRLVGVGNGEEYWPYERDIMVGGKREKQKQHLHDLSEIISENQLMRKMQRQLQRREDKEYLEFMENSNIQRDAKENGLKKRIAEELEAREEIFKIQGTNHSIMVQRRQKAQDTRHARIESEMKKQEQAEDSRKKMRQASLKSDLLEKLAEMNEARAMENELLKMTTKREGEEAKKRAEEFKQQMVEERRRYLEKKEKQKRDMEQEMKKTREIRRKHNQLDLLDRREFGLNKYKLMEMGIFDEQEQEAVAGDFTLRRHEMLSERP